MASNPATIEDPSQNSNTDEETIALKKKRSRRVSFADREITSVHIFNRDDEYETPPDPPSTKSPISDTDDEVRAFFGDLADSDDSKEISSPTGADDDDNDYSINSRKSFFRPVESPSPGGSSIVGSASCNDEDNFFGPVSASFIRAGRLSDSGASDCNLDVTMDSTAFSMHYRSLVRSVSGEEFKTPTEVRVAAEEKTPSNITTPSDPGSSMVLTQEKKVTSQNVSGFVQGSGGRDSNDMSLVGENLKSYDYGKLSPGLEALLSEAMKEPQAASGFLSDSSNVKLLERSEVSMFDENESSCMDRKDCEDIEVGKFDMLDVSTKGVSVASMELDEANVISVSTNAGQCSTPDRTQGVAVDAFTHHQVQSPIQLSKVQTADQLGGVQMPNQLSKIQTPNQMSILQTPNQMMPVKKDHSKAAIAMDVELPDASVGITSKMDTQVLKLNSLKKHESGQHSAGILKDHYFEDRRNQYNNDHNSDQQHSSISSLSAKRRQEIFLDASNSCRQLSYATPSPKQPDCFLSKANLKSSGIQPSPLVSSLKDRIEISKLRLSKFISSATSFNSGVEENNKADKTSKQVDSPVMNLEKHFSSIGPKDRDHERLRLRNIVGYGTVAPSDFDNLTNSGGTVSLSEDGESLMHMSACILSKEREVRPHILAKKSDRTSVIPESSSSVEIKVDFTNLLKTTNASDNFVSPPLKVLDQGLSSIQHQESLSGDMKQQLTFDEPVSVGSNQDKNSVGNVSISAHATAVTDKLLSWFAERKPQSGSLLDINYSEDSSQVKWVDDRQGYLQNKHGASKSPMNFQTPLRERDASNIHPVRPDRNILIVAPDLRHSEEELPGERNKSSLYTSASVYSPKNVNGSSLKDIQSSSGRKRRIRESVLDDAEHAEEIGRIKRSPENRNPHSDMKSMLESYESINDREVVIDGSTVKHWTDISLKFSGDTKQLLSPSIDKLNIKVIGVLQDILVHLQKVKKFEMLCSQIQPQKTCDLSSEVRSKRIDETRSVLSKLVFERARLQLMSAKREKLLKRARQLSSAIQESKILKSNSIWQLSVPGEVDDNLQNSCVDKNGRKIEDSDEKVITMRHEAEALDRNIKSLTKSFHSYYKMKGEQSSGETIALVNDHLKRRTSCRFIRKDLQLWEVEDLRSRNGQLNFVLNYHDFISQRFTINAVPTRSISIANQLKHTTIMKIFPNMDACVAFSYALNSETTKKYASSKILAQETQVTSSLLHNLLDVTEEVQQAQIEIRNLVKTSFSSPSVEKLDLLLCFVDFNTGWKVVVTLDMTCLNRGVYPLAAVPYELQASTNGTHKLLPESLSAQVKAAVDNLRIGFSRIARLCKCISQVMQSLST
ncbi:PREDICTED: uncharacterized protein LOC105140484 isoform X2 [Populus euphratica]|uniref:Uncharacterized protein LOC105140484 isoform X2 n=1 Tax=Populus euphratica TaxID=75702 RepID=A0AAJ6Y7U5_POPEU|nr:PREDICTED: uncharacterized protein LOC105140484 isoform X2 [Populus euphratica]